MQDLELHITLEGPIPVYRQVLDQLRTLCVEARLKPGDRLPSVRELARRLGIHFNTVAEAYRTLAEEGWLEIVQGRGAQVRDRLTPQPAPAAAQQHVSRIRHLVAELRSLGLDPEWIRREVNQALSGAHS